MAKEFLSLPIDDFLAEIQSRLQSSANLVLTAAPGAGKTTRLPPALLDIVPGRVLVLEPRRMAAVAAAQRIAEERGWKIGQEIGWQVRFDNRTSAETRLIFLTEALLTRRLQRDPELKGVDIVVLDEFHERSLHTDLALGLLKELQDLGHPLKIVVMSATLQADRVCAFLGGAPLVQVPGRLFELNVLHQKNPLRLQTDPAFYRLLVEVIQQAQAQTSKDLLVFLPGAGEIARTQEQLMPWAQKSGLDLVPLHGGLKLEEQTRALRAGPRQRIVLSTNLAESSVTVDGVDTVIDTGLAKQSRYDWRTGFSRLELTRISLNSAIQRSGRAARQFPGRSFRLWNKQDELSMPKDEIPEIQRADLSEALLFLAGQGLRDFAGFSWFEPPPPALLSSAERQLRLLGALDEDLTLTQRGRRLLPFPLSPRLAALLLEAGERGEGQELACVLAACLQEKDFLSENAIRPHRGDRLECDLTLRWQLFSSAPSQVQQSARQLKDILKTQTDLLPQATKPSPPTSEPLLIRRLLLSAFADRLCRRRAQSRRALMVGGRGLELAPSSLVDQSEFFLALQGIEGLSESETRVSLACGLEKTFLFEELGERIQKKKHLHIDEEKGQIYEAEFRVFEDLPLEEPNLRIASAEVLEQQLPELLLSQWSLLLKKNEALAAWFQRWAAWRRFSPDSSNETFEFTDELKKEILAEACYGEKSLDGVAKKDLIWFFEKALPPGWASRFQADCPARLTLPSGKSHAIHYPEGLEPYLEARLQEFFGWAQTPRILGGQKALNLHLLGPNYRPVQVTSDLASFWKNGYPEVRKELRARYPKHSWPEDPLSPPRSK